MGDMGIFSGLLYCAECGGKMYQCRTTNFTEEQKYFICSTYRKGKDLCTTHSIKNVVLHEIVLKNLREAIQYAPSFAIIISQFVVYFNDISLPRYDIRRCRMIYLLRKYDMISVPIIRKAYIICEADIIPAGYITRSCQGTDIIEKSLFCQ